MNEVAEYRDMSRDAAERQLFESPRVELIGQFPDLTLCTTSGPRENPLLSTRIFSPDGNENEC